MNADHPHHLRLKIESTTRKSMTLLRHIPCALALVLLSGLVFISIAKPRRLPSQIIDFVLNDACSTWCSTEERETYKRYLKFELKDLNGDNRPEFFVYIDHVGFCGMGFNCEYWVFQRRRNHYHLMARHPVMRVASTVTNGFRDLESQGYLGACVLPDGTQGRHIYLTVFKYTGKKYTSRTIGEQCRLRTPTSRPK